MPAVDVNSRGHRTRTHTYQFSLRTIKEPVMVLDDFAARHLPGIGVDERGENYLILRPERKARYGGDIAVILGVLIVFAVLILTAVTPVFVALLPLAVVPAIPPLLDHRPDIAMSAVDDDDAGGTRVTVHGQATPELAAALDAYLGSLPRYVPPEPAVDGSANRTGPGISTHPPTPRPPTPRPTGR
jgi:hypothetical protein